ncbi:hypothetical protein J4E81_010076 [Alternaria sp. BMP 2799]|nr:hypothetical protein J4E81_010076 [Alternaria sp. BMP 2799]
MALNFLTMDLASVTVQVGEADASVDITVYRNMLSAVSPYFRGAFEGSFVEATDRFMSLTDVTEQTFRMFLQWAHAQGYQHPSDATVPPPVVLLQESKTKNTDNSTTSAAKEQPPRRPESVAGYTPAIDVQSGREKPKELKEMEGLCHKNPEWISRYGLSVLSFLRLYVFADKYDVPQLRDDVLTAMVAQVRALREMNEDFAFDSTAVQNERLKKTQSSEGMPAWLWQALPNSCTLHEHLGRDAAKCRLRIRDQPYIFTGLVEMCVQDAASTAKESDEKHTFHKEKD